MARKRRRKYSSCYATSLSPTDRLDLYEKLYAFHKSVVDAYPHTSKRILGNVKGQLDRERKKQGIKTE